MITKIILLLSILPILGFSVNRSQKDTSGLQLFSKLKISVKQSEVNIATQLKKAFKLSQKGKIKTRVLKRLSSSIKRKPIFKEYLFWTKGLILVKNLPKISNLRNFCSKVSEKYYVSKTKEFLNKNLIKNCFNQYIKAITKKAKRSLKFHQSEVKFIKFHTKYITDRFNSDAIESLLQSFKVDGAKHKLYSNTLLNYYMALKITPSKNVLSGLSLEAKHTRYLQGLDLESMNTKYVFYREFKAVKKKAFKAVDEGTNSKQIVEFYHHALNYFNLTLHNQPLNKAVLTLESLSKSYMRRGYYTEARKGFTTILKLDSKHYDTTMFDHIWSFILEKNYEGVLKVVKQYDLDLNYLNKNPKIHFWLANAYNELDQTNRARDIYISVIKENPLNYYSILSAKLLSAQTGTENVRQIYTTLLQEGKTHFNKKTLDLNRLKRILLWGKVHQPVFLNLEMANIKNSNNKDYIEQNLVAAAQVLSRHKEYLKSFQVIYRSLNEKHIALSPATLNILFPSPFYNQIKYNSKKFDPVIALSLIRQESGFNTRARSHVGARGLMQLMPKTAKQLKRRLKTKHLYKAKLNIRLGTKFFAKLMNHYDENLVYSLAAYNAGKKRVDEWQSSYLNQESILVNIENIPFAETRKYVKLIFRNIFFYKMLGNKKATDTNHLNKIYDIDLGFIR